MFSGPQLIVLGVVIVIMLVIYVIMIRKEIS
jgi:hypothetical protein